MDKDLSQGPKKRYKEREQTFSYCVPTSTSSHLDIEAETSVFVRSHLDQDQIIMWDNSI